MPFQGRRSRWLAFRPRLWYGVRMDLDFDLTTIRTRGRAAKPVDAFVARELVPADIALLATERGVKAPPVKHLKASHHALARCLASGMKPNEASMATGYSASRISILQADPAFQDLIKIYTDQAQANYEAGMEAMRSLHLDSVELLHERVQSEDVDTVDLIKIVEKTSDRIGLGPKSTSINVNLDATAARLEAARRRAGLAEFSGPTLDLAPNTEEPIA